MDYCGGGEKDAGQHVNVFLAEMIRKWSYEAI